MGVTIFIFSMVCMMLPMKIMNTRRQAQAALEAVGEDLSKYSYVQSKLEKADASALPQGAEALDGFTRYFADGAAKAYLSAVVESKVNTKAFQNLRAEDSLILEDGETIDLVIEYDIDMPFPVLMLSHIPQSVRCRRRAWIGKAGKDYGEGGTGTEESDEVVYVGKGSTRYHRSRNCHYLSNRLTAVALEAGKTYSNADGKHYKPCNVCAKHVKAGDTVYLMPSGQSYHSERECRAIIAYVRTVKLTEVEHLGACSYCSS